MEAKQVSGDAGEMVTETCEHHGDYQTQALEVMGKRITMGCPVCEQEQEAKRKAHEDAAAKASKERRVRQLASDALIPKRFAGYGFDDYQPQSDKSARILATCKRYAEKFEDRLAMGGGLVLCGKPGTGKTHLACAIANHIITEFCRVPLFTSVTKMSRAVKSTYSTKSDKTESEMIREFVQPDLLILDEVGAQRGTETELLLAQEIIDERYQQVRPTILISNLPETELAKYIGDRALDRMYEGGGAVLAFDWDSYRRTGNARRYEQQEPVTDDGSLLNPYGRY